MDLSGSPHRRFPLPFRVAGPTLILDKARAVYNMERMARKARVQGVRFRPHFKTHQSALIGAWFRNVGVECITVSSVTMAAYFADNGWKDITIAFPVNLLETQAIDELARRVDLGVLVESQESVRFLQSSLTSHVNAWIKIDTGYGRTGIPWTRPGQIVCLAEQIERAGNLSLRGLLTHAGHSYHARSKQQIESIHGDTVDKLQQVRQKLASKGFHSVELSVGDTPTCSVVDDLSDVDEIRPGNFIFYDVTQLTVGACGQDDIAVAVACPVVAKHADRSEIVIYGGAVHLAKESLAMEDGTTVYGLVSRFARDGWGPIIADAYVSSLSQEHGVVRAGSRLFDEICVGDVLAIIPVHSCLTVNLMREYVTLDGERIETSGAA